MTAAPPAAPFACWLIRLYQHHLSPRKGFRCAYRARHPTRASCSQFARRAIERLGVLPGIRLLRRRFQRCHAASEGGHGPTKPRRQSNYLDRLGACANPSERLEAEAVCCAAEAGSEACCSLLT